MFGLLQRAKDALVENVTGVATSVWNNMPTIFSGNQPAEQEEPVFVELEEEEDAVLVDAKNVGTDKADAENEDPSMKEIAAKAFRNARARPAPSWIQKLKARVKGVANKVQAKMSFAPVKKAASAVSGWLGSMIGGEIGTLFKMLPVYGKALSGGLKALKAVEAGLTLLGVVIEAVRSVIETVIGIVKSIFSGIVSFFTGCKDAAVEIFTPEQNDEDGGESDNSLAMGAGLAAAAGLGALLLNRDKIAPTTKQAMEAATAAHAQATNIAGVVYEGTKKAAMEGLDCANKEFSKCPEFTAFKHHANQAAQGFTEIRNAARNFTADDVATMIKRGLQHTQ